MAAPVVLDTNVLVSSAIKKLGSESHLVDLVAATLLDCIVSNAILIEYAEVLHRPKLKLERSGADYLLQVISRRATLVAPTNRLTISPDESDNRFLECAEAAEADFLVTGNKRHFPRQWKTTAVVNARELLVGLNG